MKVLLVGWYTFIFISGLLSGYFKNPIFIGMTVVIGILWYLIIRHFYNKENKLKELDK